MNAPILTRRLIFNLFLVFISVGTVAAVSPIPDGEPPIVGSTINIPLDKDVLGMFLAK